MGFQCLDFGDYGSDEITMQIFALTDDPYDIQIYERNPDEEGILWGILYIRNRKSGMCIRMLFSTESKIERYYRTLFCFSGENACERFLF